MANPTLDNTKILYYGLQANYDAITTKDSTILYFCTDTKRIYKGDIEMTEQIIFAASKASVASPVAGKLYIFADTGTVEVHNGTAWTVVSYPILKSVAGGGAGITVSSTDTQVPSAKAVYDYVQGIIGGDDVVTAIEASETTEGAIDVIKGDGTSTEVVVPGVVTTPSFDAQTRTFTFPISDGNDVVVELGKDIFIDPTANNRYENGNIYLYLNDGTQTTNPTEIVIPVTALITDYFGDNTSSVSVTVDNTTHKVTADVRIRPDSSVTGSEFENLVKVSSVTGAEGIYVDAAPVRANTAAIQTLNGADTVTGSVAYAVKQLADGAVATNTAAITTLNGDASTTGSVAYAVKAATDSLEQEISDLETNKVDVNTAAITTLNGADTVTGSVAYTVKQATDPLSTAITNLETNKVDVNAANIQVLATAQGWGTF